MQPGGQKSDDYMLMLAMLPSKCSPEAILSNQYKSSNCAFHHHHSTIPTPEHPTKSP